MSWKWLLLALAILQVLLAPGGKENTVVSLSFCPLTCSSALLFLLLSIDSSSVYKFLQSPDENKPTH